MIGMRAGTDVWRCLCAVVGDCINVVVINAGVLFQAEDGIRDLVRSRGLGDVYKRQAHARQRGRSVRAGRRSIGRGTPIRPRRNCRTVS